MSGPRQRNGREATCTAQMEKASTPTVAPGVEKRNSRGMMGWIRQNSIRRFRSRDASQTPRDLKDDDDGRKAPRTDGRKEEAGQEARSLAAMFKSVPRAESPDDGGTRNHQQSATFHRSHTAQSLRDIHSADGSANEFQRASTQRSIRSDPGDLSDASVHFADTHPHSMSSMTRHCATGS